MRRREPTQLRVDRRRDELLEWVKEMYCDECISLAELEAGIAAVWAGDATGGDAWRAILDVREATACVS